MDDIETQREALLNKVKSLSKGLNDWPKTEIGLPTEATRLAPAYRQQKAAYQRAHDELRHFNRLHKRKVHA